MWLFIFVKFQVDFVREFIDYFWLTALFRGFLGVSEFQRILSSRLATLTRLSLIITFVSYFMHSAI